jgi:hypothetical protein
MDEDFEFSMMHPEGAPGQIQQILGDEAFKQWVQTQQEQRIQSSELTLAKVSALNAQGAVRVAWAGLIGALAALLVVSIPALAILVYRAALG